MDDKPKNLRSMLAYAKDLSELMVDIAYAALYFDAPDMALEVEHMEAQMSELVSEMLAVCVLAERNPKHAKGMSSVLQVISAIERIGNDAVDISRIVTNKLGIPTELLSHLASAEEVCLRVEVAEGSDLANRTIESLELPVLSGTRISAIRRENEWSTQFENDLVLIPGDVLILVGKSEGIERLRDLAGIPPMETIAPPKNVVPDMSRAVDVLVEMKDLSGTAVDLAYSSLATGDKVLAAEVYHLEALLDEMRERLELWVLQAAQAVENPAELRGLLHLATSAEDIGDQANQMVWTVQKGDLHPILEIAIGDSVDVAVLYPIREGSKADSVTLGDLELNVEPGFVVLAIRRGNRYIHRPSTTIKLQAEDELIAVGPNAGRETLAELLGWVLVRNEETNEEELVSVEE